MSQNREPRAASPSYPSADIERAASCASCALSVGPCAPISAVEPGSPADDAGFYPGCFLTSVDGAPLRDVIDWRWLSDGDEIRVGYLDADGDAGEAVLEREPGKSWGFSFEGLVFDDVIQCRNACTFCFMHQLPRGLRPSLTLRDDDFRLSFLVGTFVTLTNLSEADERRIVEQRITPLRVSLQAADAAVRRAMIGRHAQHGIDALDRLLAQRIEVHAQIVLVPDVNDGDVLRSSLDWAYARPGILDVGIVPLGYTRYQKRFDRSFDEPDQARAVLDLIVPFQERAQREREHAWVFAADEFYLNAYGDDVAAHVPPTLHYGDFSLFEDGIGIVRSFLDDWERALAAGSVARAAAALEEADLTACLIAGCAQRPFLKSALAASPARERVRVLFVVNEFFGGNVDVTGLLVGRDIARAVRRDADGDPCHGARTLYLVPRVVLNDGGAMLDDMRVQDVEKEAGRPLAVVSCSPLDYFDEIADLARAQASSSAKELP